MALVIVMLALCMASHAAPTQADAAVEEPYMYMPRHCVAGHNIAKYTDQTVAQCQQKCDENPRCMAIEYGMDYGGHGYNPGDCVLNDAKDPGTCSGTANNLDLYVKRICAWSLFTSHKFCKEGTWLYAGRSLADCQNTALKMGMPYISYLAQNGACKPTSTCTPIYMSPGTQMIYNFQACSYGHYTEIGQACHGSSMDAVSANSFEACAKACDNNELHWISVTDSSFPYGCFGFQWEVAAGSKTCWIADEGPLSAGPAPSYDRNSSCWENSKMVNVGGTVGMSVGRSAIAPQAFSMSFAVGGAALMGAFITLFVMKLRSTRRLPMCTHTPLLQVA